MTTKEISITATSGGNYGGDKANISVDGKEIGFGNYGTGINLAVFEETTGKLLFSTNFAPFIYQGYGVIPEAFADFINSLPEGRIVALAVKGDAGYATDKTKAAFKAIGSSKIDQLQPGGQSIALIGIKGNSPGSAHESISWLETSSTFTDDVAALKQYGGFTVEAISKPSTASPPYYWPVIGGDAQITLNEASIALEGDGTGWNLVVFDRKSGEVKTRGSYNPSNSAEVDALVNTLEEVVVGDIVAIATKDYAYGSEIDPKVKKTFSSIGSTMVSNLKYGGSWAIIGYKGAKPGKAVENLVNLGATQPVVVKYWQRQMEPPKKDLELGQKLSVNGSFGYDVGIDGDYAIISYVVENNDNDKAYIFQWHNNQWQMQAKLVRSPEQNGNFFGCAVDICDDFAIVGDYRSNVSNKRSCGAVHIYELKDGEWKQKQQLAPSGAYDCLGYSVAIDGKVAIAGSPYADASGKSDCGAAYIFHLEDGKWMQKEKLQPLDLKNHDRFGNAVAIDGNVAIVGVSLADTPGKTSVGAAYIFHYEGGKWKQQNKLQPLDLDSDDHFGSSVAISGNWAIVGAFRADASGKGQSGAAYIFQLQDGGWQLHQKIVASDVAIDCYFGTSVAIGNGVAVVGAPGVSHAVYLFQLVNNKWVEQQKLVAEGGWGRSLSFDGRRAIAGGEGLAYVCDVTTEA